MAIYIRQPFAISGDKTTIPVAPPPAGEVSYESGFGVNYQLDPVTDPDALDVPRLEFNQLMFDITSNVQQYQQLGFPFFITTSDNGGSPFSYSRNAFVRYDDGSGFEIYYSLVNLNTSLPTDTTKWAKVTFSAGEIPGAMKMYVGATLPSGYVYGNGTTIGSAASGATGRANADTSTLYSLLWDAYPNSTLPIQDSTGIATTRGANAAADFAANKRLPTPDMRDCVPMGKSDMGGTAARGLVTLIAAGFSPTTLGATGGSQAITLTENQNGTHTHVSTAANAGTHFHTGTTNTDGAHVHNILISQVATNAGPGNIDGNTSTPNTSTAGKVESTGSTHNHLFNTNTSGDHTHVLTINNSGLGEAHQNMQPTTVVNYIIKL
jgi:microcystin-dependent protein